MLPWPCTLVSLGFFAHSSVTMQAQKEAPPDMQCRDKFLLQSAVVNPGTTSKDITPEMVILIFLLHHALHAVTAVS